MSSLLPEVNVTIPALRRFWLRAQLLDTPVSTVGAALAHHGYIQIDPLNVCGRMHDLILRNRVTGYREGDLMRFLHGEENTPHAPASRVGFEHHIPGKNILVAFASDAWPHLLSEMQARARRTGAWSGKLTAREKEFAPALLAELAARGPLSSEDLHDGRRSYRGWGASTLAKTTLQKLFFHGRVLIAARKSQRRYYSLPESVLPSAVLAQPRPTPQETARWLILLKLRQHRLVKLSKADLAKVEDRVASVVVTGVGGSNGSKNAGGTTAGANSSLKLFCLREDMPLFELDSSTAESAAISTAAPTTRVETSQPLGRLLAPLDPLIYNRPHGGVVGLQLHVGSLHAGAQTGARLLRFAFARRHRTRRSRRPEGRSRSRQVTYPKPRSPPRLHRTLQRRSKGPGEVPERALKIIRRTC